MTFTKKIKTNLEQSNVEINASLYFKEQLDAEVAKGEGVFNLKDFDICEESSYRLSLSVVTKLDYRLHDGYIYPVAHTVSGETYYICT